MEGETSKIKKLASVERLNLNVSDPMIANLFSIFIAVNIAQAYCSRIYTHKNIAAKNLAQVSLLEKAGLIFTASKYLET